MNKFVFYAAIVILVGSSVSWIRLLSPDDGNDARGGSWSSHTGGGGGSFGGGSGGGGHK
ncbi:MAG: hypothetical protein V4754_22205 [Pseudomonadota bacterium]